MSTSSTAGPAYERVRRRSWFDIDAYPRSRDPHYWAVELANRLFLRRHLEESQDAPWRTVEEISEQFLWVVGQVSTGCGSYLEDLSILDYDLGPADPVEPLTPLRLKALNEAAHGTTLWEDSATFEFPRDMDLEREFYTTPLHLLEDFDIGNRIAVVVNADVDDETLTRRLVELLSAAREVELEKRALSIRDYDNWSTYRILPIFDLRFAGDLLLEDTIRREIAQAIWPDRSMDAETLRKTAEPHLRKALQWSTVQRLRALAGRQDYRLY